MNNQKFSNVKLIGKLVDCDCERLTEENKSPKGAPVSINSELKIPGILNTNKQKDLEIRHLKSRGCPT